MTQHLFEQRNHPEAKAGNINRQPVRRAPRPAQTQDREYAGDQKTPDGQRSFILRRFLHVE